MAKYQPPPPPPSSSPAPPTSCPYPPKGTFDMFAGQLNSLNDCSLACLPLTANTLRQQLFIQFITHTILMSLCTQAQLSLCSYYYYSKYEHKPRTIPYLFANNTSLCLGFLGWRTTLRLHRWHSGLRFLFVFLDKCKTCKAYKNMFNFPQNDQWSTLNIINKK